jgi:hypothetical protein
MIGRLVVNPDNDGSQSNLALLTGLFRKNDLLRRFVCFFALPRGSPGHYVSPRQLLASCHIFSIFTGCRVAVCRSFSNTLLACGVDEFGQCTNVFVPENHVAELAEQCALQRFSKKSANISRVGQCRIVMPSSAVRSLIKKYRMFMCRDFGPHKVLKNALHVRVLVASVRLHA